MISSKLIRPALVALALLASAAISDLSAQAAPAPAASAPAASGPTLDAAEVSDLFGTWTLSLVTPDGTVPIAFNIGEQDGRAAVRFGGADGQAITDIRKAEGGFVARSLVPYQGMSLPVQITVAKDGENLKTEWSFAEGAYVTSATATRGN
jgi:hypothetical protein